MAKDSNDQIALHLEPELKGWVDRMVALLVQNGLTYVLPSDLIELGIELLKTYEDELLKAVLQEGLVLQVSAVPESVDLNPPQLEKEQLKREVAFLDEKINDL